MKREVIVTGKTVDEAIENGLKQYKLDAGNVKTEVVELPKKGILGIGAAPAKVKLTYSEIPADIALDFVKTVVREMELDVTVEMDDKEEDGGRVIRIKGDGAGVLIGRHGDTLDAFQYLVNLAANKKEDGLSRNYTKIYLDIENYRDKREETLKALARRMAAKVLKNHKSMTLEPMNPYERRIIHSEIQGIEGVTTVSVGVENNRRVVISPDDKPVSAKGGRRRRSRSRKPSDAENTEIPNEEEEQNADLDLESELIDYDAEDAANAETFSDDVSEPDEE